MRLSVWRMNRRGTGAGRSRRGTRRLARPRRL